MTDKQSIAINIVELFEDFLEEHGIIIPDDDRPADNNTPIYGVTWSNLVDEVATLIGYASAEEHQPDVKQTSDSDFKSRLQIALQLASKVNCPAQVNIRTQHPRTMGNHTK